MYQEPPARKLRSVLPQDAHFASREGSVRLGPAMVKPKHLFVSLRTDCRVKLFTDINCYWQNKDTICIKPRALLCNYWMSTRYIHVRLRIRLMGLQKAL